MPHISNYLINGIAAPSVNEVTGTLSKDSLINNFWRKLGFQKADIITETARNRGITIAEMFEKFRKGDSSFAENMAEFELSFLKSWTDWQHENKYEVVEVEPHLESVKYHYHGSPDGLGRYPLGSLELFDDKVKDKLADYKTLMNEAAYAQCWLEKTGERIEKFRIFTYHPKSARLYMQEYDNKQQYFDDFLRCREMLEVNKRAQLYYDVNCKKRLGA